MQLPPLQAISSSGSGTANFATALQRLVALRVRRPLSTDEAATITAALDEGLSVLQAGGAGARQQLLAMNLGDALATQGGAWLWATTLEATATNPPVVATLATAIVEGASAVAAMIFAQAATVFGTPAMVMGETAPCIFSRRRR